MNQSYVVVAFRTSGDSPSKGARVTQLLLVKLSEAGKEVAKLGLPEDREQVSGEPVLTPEFLSRLVEFVGQSHVVTHDGYNWKRFLRQELASQSKGQVKEFLAQTVDVSEWSQQRFPKQRKDMRAICKRLKIELPVELQGLEHEAEVIRLIMPHMLQAPVRLETPIKTVAASTLPAKEARKIKQISLNFNARLRHAWKVLMGKGA
jgi:DNA polymerase III epsilon subunit-like protein